MSSRSSLVASTITAAVMLGAAGLNLPGAHAATAPDGFRPFSPDSIWNQPLRDDAPLNSHSAQYSSYFASQVQTYGSYINSSSCGNPTFWAEPDAPRISVTLVHPSYMDPALMRAFASVPMPPEAATANCSDRNFAILQRQPDGTVDEWEFFSAVKASDGTWSASWGGATQDIERDRGVASSFAWSDPTAPANARRSKYGWNVSASSMSTLAGLITLDEMRAGRIDHAVAMNITKAAAYKWLWPAQRTDGGSTDEFAIPEGAHFRLDPALDLQSVSMSPIVRMIAEAAQTYGVVVRDTTGGVNTFVAEQPRPGETNPLYGLLGGQTIQDATKKFPWSRLQLLDAKTCSGYSSECIVTDRAALAVEAGSEPGTVRLDTRNSTLNMPRTSVRWDLDGNGTFETDGGRGSVFTTERRLVGSRVGVRLETRSGIVSTATADVSPDPGASAGGDAPPTSTTPPPTTPTTPPTTTSPTTTSPATATNAPTTPTTTAVTAPPAVAGATTPAHGSAAPAAVAGRLPGATGSSPAPGVSGTPPKVAAGGVTVRSTKVVAFTPQRRSTIRVTLVCDAKTACSGRYTLSLLRTGAKTRALPGRRFRLAPRQSVRSDVVLGPRLTRALGRASTARMLTRLRTVALGPERIRVVIGVPATR